MSPILRKRKLRHGETQDFSKVTSLRRSRVQIGTAVCHTLLDFTAAHRLPSCCDFILVTEPRHNRDGLMAVYQPREVGNGRRWCS